MTLRKASKFTHFLINNSTTQKSTKKAFLIATIILFFITTIKACPLEVKSMCQCIDKLEGIELNCSRVDVIGLINVLRVSQSQLGVLKSLSIRQSTIPVISDKFFAGLFIKKLELKDLKTKTIENQAFSGLEQVLQELSIVNNEITSIPVHALNGFNGLLKLDFSNNSIQELKSKNALPRLPKLFDINLSHNKINNVHKTFFENVKGSLQTINLGHNNISEVPASALRGFRQLMALHLHNNNFKNLTALSFMNLPVLSLLNLASNKIQNIHRQAFLNVPSLHFLYMPDNKLTEILAHQFTSFEQLEMLDLSNNRIEVINSDSFANLESIKQIYLGENRISKIENYAFTNSSVAIIILEANQITEIKKETFHGAVKLQQISLKENKIKNVDANAFYNNPGLVMTDLSHNDILDLAPATFLSQLNMLFVDLSYNKMLRTPYSAFSRRVVTVLLQENPLVCNEKIHMLQQGVGVHVPNSEDKVCGIRITESSLLHSNNSSVSANSTEPIVEESAFIQQNVPMTDQLQKFIKPIEGSKKLSTTQINHFVEASQTENFSLNPNINEARESEKILIRPISTLENTDEIIKDDRILPIQVPFLTRPPKIHTSHNIVNNSGPIISTQTLPPSILIAPVPKDNFDLLNNLIDSKNTTITTQHTKIAEFELHEEMDNGETNNIQLDRRINGKFPYDFKDGAQIQEGRQDINSSRYLSTAIIVICLTTAAVVTCGVFVGLCIAKQRQLRLRSSMSGGDSTQSESRLANHLNSNSYMAAAAAAHAAQMNVIYSGGSLHKGSLGTLNQMPSIQDDIYGWLYTPSHQYHPYSK